MSTQHVDHLLIGGGIASASCARALRERGAEGSIVLLGRELDPPYHRPPATKAYLQGRHPKEDAFVLPAAWYEDNGVELRSRTSVRSLDPEARTVTVQGGDELSFGTALVATGAQIRRISADGDDLDGLHYVRALGNADAIRRDAEDAEKVVLVGGSYIGCEVAASLTAMGKRCTVLMMEDEPLQRGFGTTVGRFVRALLAEHGVEIVGADEVARFVGADERVRSVETKGGRSLDADVVVLGTGAVPDVMLAKASGLTIGETGGVWCDAQLQTASPGVYAAGDMCEYESVIHGRRLRIEHEDVAQRQGELVAANMLGAGEDYRTVPYFWTDLADWGTIEYVGPAARWDEEIVRGSIEDGAFSVLYLDEGRLAACAAVGRHQDLKAATQIIGAGGALAADRAALADAQTPLPGA